MCTEFSQGNPSCQDIRSDGEMPFRLYTLLYISRFSSENYLVKILLFFRKLLSLVSALYFLSNTRIQISDMLSSDMIYSTTHSVF